MSCRFIALQQGTPRDWMLASDTLVQAAGMNKTDAAKACRKGFGLILNEMSEEAAEAGALALNRVGINARCFAASQLVQAPSPIAAVSFSIEKDMLICRPATGIEPMEIPLAGIRIVYAGYLVPAKQTNEKAAMAEWNLKSTGDSTVKTIANVKAGISVGLAMLSGIGVTGVLADMRDPRNIATPARVPQTPEVCLDLVCASPLQRIRFRQTKYDYTSLGARRLPAMRRNFQLIVKELLAVLPRAVQIGQVKEAASGGKLEEERFLREDADLSAEMTAILSRDAVFGMTE